ncbi:MAG: hypothetical protein XXXJIFNMEKO3_01522 [Candidatus Erwinia impunctatus]|nr:hypothetical protein XXXJIFNMEKO_01522 [Culicoides impunctatus]
MSITAGSLYRDTGNFLRNQLLTVVLIALFASLVHTVLAEVMAPDAAKIVALMGSETTDSPSLVDLLNNLSDEDRTTLLGISAAATISNLVGNTLLLGGILGLLSIISSGSRVSALQAMAASLPRLLSLLLLAFVMTLVIQFGFALFVLPGVILAVLLSLSPVILYSEKIGVFSSLRLSIRLGWRHLKLVSPVIAYWILAKLLNLMLANHLGSLPAQTATILIGTLSNLISAALLIYLFRLYMLLRSQSPA